MNCQEELVINEEFKDFDKQIWYEVDEVFVKVWEVEFLGEEELFVNIYKVDFGFIVIGCDRKYSKVQMF